VVTDLGAVFHGLEVRRLEDVFGSIPVFNADRQKAQELCVLSSDAFYSTGETDGSSGNFLSCHLATSLRDQTLEPP
jgi:hypothetical protein